MTSLNLSFPSEIRVMMGHGEDQEMVHVRPSLVWRPQALGAVGEGGSNSAAAAVTAPAASGQTESASGSFSELVEV